MRAAAASIGFRLSARPISVRARRSSSANTAVVFWSPTPTARKSSPVTGHSGGFVSFEAEPPSFCGVLRAVPPARSLPVGNMSSFRRLRGGRQRLRSAERRDCAEVCTGRCRRAVGTPCRGCRSFVSERDAARHILGENVPTSPNNRYLCTIYIGKLKFLIDENRSCSVELYDRRH